MQSKSVTGAKAGNANTDVSVPQLLPAARVSSSSRPLGDLSHPAIKKTLNWRHVVVREGVVVCGRFFFVDNFHNTLHVRTNFTGTDSHIEVRDGD